MGISSLSSVGLPEAVKVCKSESVVIVTAVTEYTAGVVEATSDGSAARKVCGACPLGNSLSYCTVMPGVAKSDPSTQSM